MSPSDGRARRASDDGVLWIGLASCAGALGVVAPVTLLVVSAVVGGLLLLRARIAAVASIAVLAVGFARASALVDRHEQGRASVVEAGGWPTRAPLEGTIARSPVLVSGSLRLELDDAVVHVADGAPIHGRVTIHVPAEVAAAAAPAMALARGDEVYSVASLAPPYRFWNDGASDPRPGSARRGALLSGGAEDLVVLRPGRGAAAWIDRARARVRARIEATFPAETAPMSRALVLGEDDLLDEDRRAFRRSGLAHLLAVSGMHLVLVVTGLVAVLKAVFVRVPALAERVEVGRLASAVGLPVAWTYAELAGGSGSAIRAAWMCSAALLARALARRATAWRSLGLSLVAMSVVDPIVVFDVSFVLSALATAGILALGRPIEAAARRTLPLRLPSFVLGPLATSAAATIACAPVLAGMSFELPISGLLANVVAVPLGEAAALPLCLGHAALAFWPAAERGSAEAASGALTLVGHAARAFTWGVVPVPPPTEAQLGVVAAAAGALALLPTDAPRARRWVAAAAALGVLALEALAWRCGAPRGTLRVTFIDVGQGDAALVDLPDGSAMLIDGGGLVGSPIDVGERAVVPLLAARRRRRVETVVLSHPHPDHYLGLSAVIARGPPAAFWDTGQGEAEGTRGAYADLLARLRASDVQVEHPSSLCGSRELGGAIVEVLAPCPDVVADRGANDNSFVLRVRYGERAVLFVGDAEHEEERDLVRASGPDGLRADVLKVGHHGSRTSSTPELLAAARPRVAVISCGVRNRFGHPHPATLEALARAGARVLRTDRDGSVVVTTDGSSLEVRTVAE